MRLVEKEANTRELPVNSPYTTQMYQTMWVAIQFFTKCQYQVLLEAPAQ